MFLSALATIAAYQIGLLHKQKIPAHIQKDEEKLIAYMIRRVIKSETNYPKWLLELLLQALPLRSKQWFFKQVYSSDYVVDKLAIKALIRQLIHEAVTRGAKQIVIIGGGYDPVGFLFAQNPEYASVRFFDLDASAICHTKKQALSSMPAGLPFKSLNQMEQTSYQLISCDLTRLQLQEKLLKHGFSTSEKSFVVLEDIFLFQNEACVKGMMKELKNILKDEDCCLVGFRPAFYASRENIEPEEIKSNFFALSFEDVISFAADHGFSVNRKALSWDLMDNIGAYEALKKNESMEEFFVELRKNDASTLKEDEKENLWRSVESISLDIKNETNDKVEEVIKPASKVLSII